MRKSILLKTLLNVSLLFALVTLFSCGTTKEVVDEESTARPDKINYINRYEDLKYLTARVYYPEIGKFEDLNNQIATTIKNDVREYALYAKENWEEGTTPFKYSVDSSIRTKRDVMGIRLSITKCDNKGNQTVSIVTFNFDRDKKKVLSLEELTGYSLEEIANLSKELLTKNLITNNKEKLSDEEITSLTSLIDEATKKDIKNFSAFIQEGDSLAIYFDDLLPAKYSDLVTKVELPLNK